MTPQQAQQIAPPVVQALAQHAVAQDPGIVQKMSASYAQHPMVVKALGAAALAVLVAKMSSMHR